MSYKELKIVDVQAVAATGDSGTQSTSVSSHSVAADLVLYLNVTSAGTGTMDITVNGIVGGVAYPLTTLTQVTGADKQIKVIADAPKDIRLDWVIVGGAPDFDFTVHALRSGNGSTA